MWAARSISNSQEAITQLTKENLKWKTFTTQYWSYKPHLNFKPTWYFLKILYVSFKWFFAKIKKKILMSVLGIKSIDRKSTRDKANISNPKLNRGCAPLTANRTSADCVQISLGPSIPYIPLGSNILEDSTLFIHCPPGVVLPGEPGCTEAWLMTTFSEVSTLVLGEDLAAHISELQYNYDMNYPSLFCDMDNGNTIIAWCIPVI